uniref:Uncharacterized protein n=1 Tax=Anguilla anguilla TaxID=7936 RepID=A0A0E9SLD6_ANGAN
MARASFIEIIPEHWG